MTGRAMCRSGRGGRSCSALWRWARGRSGCGPCGSSCPWPRPSARRSSARGCRWGSGSWSEEEQGRSACGRPVVQCKVRAGSLFCPMNPVVQEWLNLIVRWAHVIAAIMWIGDSFLFMWLDSQLRKPDRDLPGTVVGEIWMAHSGGFYEVVKRKSLDALPPKLHWFKWESYTTWITGVLLLIIVYYLGGRAMLVDADSPLSERQAIFVSVGLIAGGLVLYDLLCRTPIVRDGRVFGVIGLAILVAT